MENMLHIKTLSAGLMAMALTACSGTPAIVEKGTAVMLTAQVPPQFAAFSIGFSAFPPGWHCRAKIKPGQRWHGWTESDKPDVETDKRDFFLEAHISSGKWLDYPIPAGQWIIENTNLSDTSDVNAVSKAISRCIAQLANEGEQAIRDKTREADTEAANRNAWRITAASASK